MLTFIHISDTHLFADPNFTGDFVNFSPYRGVKKIIEYINKLPMPIDFVLHTGDVMTDPKTAEDYLVAKDVFAELKCPVHYMPGNHDDPAGMRRYLLDKMPNLTPQSSYQFEAKGTQVICLNSHLAGEAAGRLGSQQLSWLDELISAPDDRPLVIALHHHTIPIGVDWLDDWILLDGEDLHQILRKAGSRLRGVFSGHIHQNMCVIRDGISYYTVLSAWYQALTWFGQATPFGEPLDNLSFNVVTLTQQDTIVNQYHVPR